MAEISLVKEDKKEFIYVMVCPICDGTGEKRVLDSSYGTTQCNGCRGTGIAKIVIKK